MSKIKSRYIEYSVGRSVIPKWNLSEGMLNSLKLTYGREYEITTIQDFPKFEHRTILIKNDTGFEKEYDPDWFVLLTEKKEISKSESPILKWARSLGMG